MEAHNAQVTKISETVKCFSRASQPFRLYHGSTNSTRASARRADNTVDTSGLDHVLEVDASKKTALVEPNVGMDTLVNATVQHGVIPLIVMEFPGITVGGAFSGSAGESSSFRYGAFDSIINWIEIVLPNGEITRASKTEQPDLFWGAASAFGTLGVVTLLEVQLREAGSYVQLTTYQVPSIAEASDKMITLASDPNVDFIDGIVFSSTNAVICVGRMVDSVPQGMKPLYFLRPYDPWFYLYVESRVKKTGAVAVDYIPLSDYLFRYDRGGFWVAKYAFRYFMMPFNRFTRFLLNHFMHTRVMYHALHKSGLSDSYIIQDVGVPYRSAEELHRWLDQELHIYPLWLCPVRIRRDSPNSDHGLHAKFADSRTPEFVLNFGVWGPGSYDRQAFIRQNRAIERKAHDLGGLKWLYAHTYYTEDEFRATYDLESYDMLRSKYNAAYLPSIYEKVKSDLEGQRKPYQGSRASGLLAWLWNIWPIPGLYGVYNAFRGGDYLLHSKTTKSPVAAINR